MDGLIQPLTIRANPLGYVSDPFKTASSNFIRGAYVKVELKYGEPIRRKQIILPSSHGYITSVLNPGMRAISIPINQLTGVAGFLAPGDRVDVLITRRWRDKTRRPIVQPRHFVEVLLSDIRLLAIDQLVNPLTGKPFVFGTVTLEVKPFDVQRITQQSPGELGSWL